VRDPETYARFEKIILVHGVRQVSDLAYHDYLAHELPDHELLGELVRKQLVYYPTATREPFRNNGRLTELVESGKLFEDLGVPPFDPATDRAMLCGSPSMLADTRRLLDVRGFEASPHIGTPGDYVFERAFVEK
jgi:ferredoxin--NADP+ reductase